MQRDSMESRVSRLAVLWILVESGALHTVTTIFLLGFSSTNTSVIFVASLGQIGVRVPLSSPSSVFLKRHLVAGAGSDVDHRARRAEKLRAVVFLDPRKRFNQ